MLFSVFICRKLVTAPPLSFFVWVKRRPKAPHTVFFKSSVAMQRGELKEGQKLCSEQKGKIQMRLSPLSKFFRH